MIPIQRRSHPAHDLRIKVVGLGGAGGNVLDRLTLDGLRDVDIVAINTDVQALAGSVATEKVQLGRATTRGLGAGGDPEVGYAAAEEGMEDIRKALEGAQMVFLCVGLGGGTGSGAARIVASLAREQNALVVSFVTLPFSFEGKRRRAQAEEALGALQRYSDVIIHFENDRMGDAVSPNAGIQDAFSVADQTLSQTVRAIAALARQRGLVHIGIDELATALRGRNDSGAHCMFGYGEADGDNRAHDALAQALKCPLMDKGRLLQDARNLLVNVAGGPSMTLDEVQILMEEMNRHINDQTRLLFGAAVDPALGQKMSVTILSALEGVARVETQTPVETRSRPATRVETSPVSVAPTATPAAPRHVEPAPEPAPVYHAPEPEPKPEPIAVIEPEPEPEPYYEPEPEREREPEVVAAELAPIHEPMAVETAPLFSSSATATGSDPVRIAAEAARAAKAKFVQAKQEQMQFEPVTRGRFEKSEPTIVDGQDLDVPTFLRRNVKVK